MYFGINYYTCPGFTCSFSQHPFVTVSLVSPVWLTVSSLNPQNSLLDFIYFLHCSILSSRTISLTIFLSQSRGPKTLSWIETAILRDLKVSVVILIVICYVSCERMNVRPVVMFEEWDERDTRKWRDYYCPASFSLPSFSCQTDIGNAETIVFHSFQSCFHVEGSITFSLFPVNLLIDWLF